MSVRSSSIPVEAALLPPEAPGSVEGGRTLLVAIDQTEDAVNTVQFAVEHVYKPGDTIHVVHVVLALQPETETFHGKGAARNFLIYILTQTLHNARCT
jgi:hypothetical protein